MSAFQFGRDREKQKVKIISDFIFKLSDIINSLDRGLDNFSFTLKVKKFHIGKNILQHKIFNIVKIILNENINKIEDAKKNKTDLQITFDDFIKYKEIIKEYKIDASDIKDINEIFITIQKYLFSSIFDIKNNYYDMLIDLNNLTVEYSKLQ